MEIIEVISKNLKAARGDMSRQELAIRAKTTYQTIRDIEEGRRKPSLEMLDQLARCLETNISDLLKSDSLIIEKTTHDPFEIIKKIASLNDKNRALLLKSIDTMLAGQEKLKDKNSKHA